MFNLNELKLSKTIVESFSELIKNNRLPHAILLYGSDSDTRTKTAVYLAASMLCQEEIKPCGKCISCYKIFENNHPDVIIADPAEQGEKTFKISLVRDIRTDAFIMPNEADIKVYILKSADKMNVQAQNALLKIIEEPPAHARFILECDSRAAMLETVLSRVTSFNLGAKQGGISDEYLIKADDLAARLAGSLTDATELQFIKLTAELEKDKNLFEPLLSSLQLIYRDAFAVKVGSSITESNHANVAKSLANKFTLNNILALYDTCQELYEALNRNANKNLLITRISSIMRKTAYGA